MTDLLEHLGQSRWFNTFWYGLGRLYIIIVWEYVWAMLNNSRISQLSVKTHICHIKKQELLSAIGKNPLHCFNWWIESTKRSSPPTVSPWANNNLSSKDRSLWTKRTSKKNWYSAFGSMWLWGKMIKHQITSCSHVHSTTEKGNTSGLLVPQWMPSFGALQMIYTWQPILQP